MQASSRCPWAGSDPLYVAYHDAEWGVPQTDGRALFEKLILEGFQAGLSWITILRKRENFRAAFEGFVPEHIARYGASDIARLMNDAGIVRNRAKIEAAIANARAYVRLEEGPGPGFAARLWELAGGRPQQNAPRTMAEVPAETARSRAMSKALKGWGFRFVGPTTIYAFMQSVGMVNDHLVGCPRHRACAALAEQFEAPR